MVVLTSFVHPDSPIHFEDRNIRAVLDKKDLGIGILYISERSVSWKKHDDEACGFSLSYHHISLHATSTDPNVYPKECLYIMIDTHVTIPGSCNTNEGNGDASGSDSESEADISELILAPENMTILRSMYDTLKQCQALNPDPDDVMTDEDDIYEDADEGGDVVQNEVSDVGAGGDAVMENLTTQMQHNTVNVIYDYINGEQNDEEFEDAD